MNEDGVQRFLSNSSSWRIIKWPFTKMIWNGRIPWSAFRINAQIMNARLLQMFNYGRAFFLREAMQTQKVTWNLNEMWSWEVISFRRHLRQDSWFIELGEKLTAFFVDCFDNFQRGLLGLMELTRRLFPQSWHWRSLPDVNWRKPRNDFCLSYIWHLSCCSLGYREQSNSALEELKTVRSMARLGDHLMCSIEEKRWHPIPKQKT